MMMSENHFNFFWIPFIPFHLFHSFHSFHSIHSIIISKSIFYKIENNLNIILGI